MGTAEWGLLSIAYTVLLLSPFLLSILGLGKKNEAASRGLVPFHRLPPLFFVELLPYSGVDCCSNDEKRPTP